MTENIFNAISISDFIENHWNEKVRHLSYDNSSSIDFSLEELNYLINNNRIKEEDIYIFHPSGKVIKLDNEQNTISDNIFIYANEGYTIRVSNIQDYSRSVHKGIVELENLFPNCQIKANTYYTRGKSYGLNPHYDSHHVLVHQIYGKKMWHYGDKVIDNPTIEFAPTPMPSPAFINSIELKMGDLLYMPPGVWHGTETNDVSLHITYGIYPPRWKDIIQSLGTFVYSQHSIARAEYPIITNENQILHNLPSFEEVESMLDLFKHEITNFYKTKAKVQTSNSRPLGSLPILTINDNNETIANVPEELGELLNEIWSLSNSSISIYLRGSFKNEDRKYTPWDLDLYLIVNNRSDIPQDKIEISNYLTKKYSELPEIDLTIVDEYSLLYDDNTIMKRLLLLRDGLLVKGIGIKKYLTVPELNQTTIEKLENLHKKFIAKITTDIKDYPEIEVVELNKLIRTLAKAFLRIGTFSILKQRAELIRDVNECAVELKSTHPEILTEIDSLLSIIKGKNMSRLAFISTIDSLNPILVNQ
ncbi:MAG: cupin domain-containing protein [Sphingobacteriales bacterium JAD_PAG50586_3]|nr:MAG: cupin domain-containing protein [Sphingobacteriales bacterium JAD_PAG50586_3]